MTSEYGDRLQTAAVEWIRRGPEARHLMHARDWLLELAPDASLALSIAALTHDVERHYPGGPTWDPFTQHAGDREYRWQHAVCSAQLVHPWLYAHGADDSLVRDTEWFVCAHELGGDEEANLLQAADSLSFLEVNPERLAASEREGRYPPGGAAEHCRWMFERIQVPRARELAQPLYEQALATLAV